MRFVLRFAQQNCRDLKKYVERRLETCAAANKEFDTATLRFTLDPTLGMKSSKNTSANVSVAGNSRRNSKQLDDQTTMNALARISEDLEEADVPESSALVVNHAQEVSNEVVTSASPRTLMKDRVQLDDVKKRGGKVADAAPILGILKNTEDTVVFYK